MGSARDRTSAFLSQVCKDELGATAVEYALLAALISIIVAGAIGAAGTKIYSLMTYVVTALTPTH